MAEAIVELAPDELMALKVFRALGDPTRMKIVRMLVERPELGCADLQAASGLSAPALSHHTRILQECGLVAMRREGQFHFFRLRKDLLERFAPGFPGFGRAARP
ncbi:MAG: winged helix-turn-helix transcriptional regulator [Chloroflexi bacterium]|nr:winged helix-turn-helix transcriptional regulator [Chloroflexota bacterium]